MSARSLIAACALVGSIASLTGCTGASGGEEPDSEVTGRDGSVSVSDLKSSRRDGVALYAQWNTDFAPGGLHVVGDPETAPRLVTAQCWGEYPDMRVKVQGPDDVVLVAESDTTVMMLDLPDLGLIEFIPPPVSYEWNPNGIDMYIDMGTGSNHSEAERLPQGTGIAQGGILIRMKVTCA